MPFYVLNAVYNSAFKTIICFISAAQEKVRKIHLRNDFRIGTANFRTAVGVHGRPLGRQHRQNPPTQQRPQGRQEQKENQTGKHAVVRVHDRACLHCFHRAKATFIYEMYLYKVFGNHVKPYFLHRSFIVVQYWLVLRPILTLVAEEPSST